MPKEDIAVLAGIFVVALIAGMLFGVGINTGISPDEGGIAKFTLETFCEAVEDLEGNITHHCGMFIFVISIISILVAVATVVEESARAGNFYVGLTIYVAGWIVGLIWMLTNLS